jgi:peptidoglycan/xylan/chitin deacetylase (PgdA/CDA1 family)
VIQYHKIDKPGRGVLVRGGFTSPRRFARQMTHLKKLGFTFHTASELLAYYRENNAFPPKGITVTFDDGWKDGFTNAFPVLKRLGIKATMFVVASCIGETSAKAMAEGEVEREHVSREDILEMSRAGIEFGSHSMNHKLLDRIPTKEIEYEVVESKRQIEDLLQLPCLTFAYPAGYYSEPSQRLIEEAGYIAAFSTVYGPADTVDLYALNRVEIFRRDRFLFQFAQKVGPFATPNG